MARAIRRWGMEKKRPMWKTRRYWRLPEEMRREIIRLAASGLRPAAIGRQLGVSASMVFKLLGPKGWVIRAEHWHLSDRRLSLDQRIEILVGVERRESFRAVGRRIG